MEEKENVEVKTEEKPKKKVWKTAITINLTVLIIAIVVALGTVDSDNSESTKSKTVATSTNAVETENEVTKQNYIANSEKKTNEEKSQQTATKDNSTTATTDKKNTSSNSNIPEYIRLADYASEKTYLSFNFTLSEFVDRYNKVLEKQTKSNAVLAEEKLDKSDFEMGKTREDGSTVYTNALKVAGKEIGVYISICTTSKGYVAQIGYAIAGGSLTTTGRLGYIIEAIFLNTNDRKSKENIFRYAEYFAEQIGTGGHDDEACLGMESTATAGNGLLMKINPYIQEYMNKMQ